jgi:hypothetical protein
VSHLQPCVPLAKLVSTHAWVVHLREHLIGQCFLDDTNNSKFEKWLILSKVHVVQKVCRKGSNKGLLSQSVTAAPTTLCTEIHISKHIWEYVTGPVDEISQVVSKTYSSLFSAKFGPFSNSFRGRVSAAHDKHAEWTCSRNVLCSKMWNPPRIGINLIVWRGLQSHESAWF